MDALASLKKYVQFVYDEEGTTAIWCIKHNHSDVEFTPDEIATLEEIDAEVSHGV